MSLRTRLLLGVVLAFAPLAGVLALSVVGEAAPWASVVPGALPADPRFLLALCLVAALGVWVVLERVVLRRSGSVDPEAAAAPAPAAAPAADPGMREDAERFRQLSHAIESVFWLADPDTSEVVYVSPAVERIWGLPREIFLGSSRAWLDSIHPEDRAETQARYRDKGAGESVEGSYRIIRPDGEVRWIRDRFFPVFDEAGRLVRVAGLADDVTRERLLSDELHQSQKIEAVGRLAGGMAHDFNNILTAIMGHAELLHMELDPEAPLRVEVDEVLRAARRAADLTGQLLAFSRRQVTRPRRIQLKPVLENMAPLLRRVAGDTVALTLELAPGVEPVLMDPTHLEQVLVNLVANARDAQPRGGQVRVITRMRTVTESDILSYLPVLEPGSYVAIEVRDRGEGIPERIMDHIFEPFFTTKEVGKGTGLGLATVYGIVKKAEGFVFATNDPEGGACFEVLLPPAPVDTRRPEAVRNG